MMFRYLLSGSVVLLVAIGFSQADVSAAHARASQAGIEPQTGLSVEEETQLGNFVLDMLGAGEGGSNIRPAIEGKLKQIENSRTAKPAGSAFGVGAQGRGRGRGRGNPQRIAVCHIPPGNPANAHTLTLPQPAVQAHIAHGDTLGACGGVGTAVGGGRGRGNPQSANGDNAGRGRDQGRGRGPGEALRRGLQDRDVPGLGRFVNERLAQGLRGEKLAAVIHAEIARRKQQR